mmetsp:Transcript_83460/g.239735  ORF Transcript_83460/g.239735 Transcript_83460/m.239735 type:complete len:223 (-) Transcript_83460:101-769(-)
MKRAKDAQSRPRDSGSLCRTQNMCRLCLFLLLGTLKGSPALCARRGVVGLGLQQQPTHGRVAAATRVVQRCVAAVVGRAEVGARGQQALHDGVHAEGAGVVQGRGLLLVSRIWVGPSVQQQPCNLHTPQLCSLVEGCAATLILGIWIRPCSEEHSRDVLVVVSPAERRLPLPVRHIRVGLGIKQNLQDVCSASADRSVQCGLVPSHRIRVCTHSDEQSRDLV